jgi:c-di-GMP-binding flagellar brake protein YcgR
MVAASNAACCATVDAISRETWTLLLSPEHGDGLRCRPKQTLDLKGICRDGVWTCTVTVQTASRSKLQVFTPTQFQILERRESFRLGLAINTTVQDLQSGEEYEASLYDLSDGGACLNAASELGDQVEVVLPIGGNDGLRARATVVHRQRVKGRKSSSILGVKFEGLRPCEARRISQFIIAEQARRVF